MKRNLIMIIALLFIGNLIVKSAVYKDTVITASNGKHTVGIAFPDDYDASKKYSLVIAIQPCNGSPFRSYLNALRPLTDSLKMIVACPDNSKTGGWIADANMDIITATIDTVKEMYNIDEKSVYFTGMSCNGEVALRQGLKKLYPFKGIFPWDPYLTVIDPKLFDFNSDMPLTIAVGTSDSYLGATLNCFDSLKNHGANVNLVLVPGIGHVFDFANFGNEMIRSIMYLNDTNSITINYSETVLPNFEMKDDDAIKELVFKVSNKSGKELIISSLSSGPTVFGNPEIVYTPLDSAIKLKLKPIVGKSAYVVITLEAKEKNGTSIEQLTFRVKVTKKVSINGLNESRLEVYPNPASDRLSLKSDEQQLSFQITDINGRVVLKSIVNNGSYIDIANLSTGLYLLTAKGKNYYNPVKFSVN